MQNRRDFLKRASLLLAGGLVAPQMLSSCGGSAAPSKHIGLQLYSLRDDIKDLGIQKVLEIVSKILQEEMENAVQLNVPLTVDVNIGENWYETK